MELCTICKKEIVSDGFGTGYGLNNENEKICYSCCGEMDKKELLENGQLYGYLSKDENGYYFGNWPGSLKIHIGYVRKSWHNFAGKDGRRDFWFTYSGANFHGINIGDNECARVKKVKN